jgi:hypothetical protein
MGLISEILQGSVQARGAHLAGKRKGSDDMRARLAAEEKARRDAEVDAANIAAMKRTAGMRDPNDPAVIREKRDADLAIERERGVGSLIADIRRAQQGTNENIARERQDYNRNAKALGEMPPESGGPLGWANPADSVANSVKRKQLEADTTETGKRIRQLEGQHQADRNTLRSLIPGLGPERSAPQTYTRGGEQVPVTARQELAKIGTQFRATVAELQRRGEREKVKQAQAIYQQRTREIIDRHKSASEAGY